MAISDRFNALIDGFAAAFVEGVNDVRHRFEETMYGRVLTEDIAVEAARTPHEPFAEQLGWERPSGRDDPDPQHDHDIDH